MPENTKLTLGSLMPHDYYLSYNIKYIFLFSNYWSSAGILQLPKNKSILIRSLLDVYLFFFDICHRFSTVYGGSLAIPVKRKWTVSFTVAAYQPLYEYAWLHPFIFGQFLCLESKQVFFGLILKVVNDAVHSSFII